MNFIIYFYETVLPWALKQGLVNPGAPSPQGMTMKAIWDRYQQVNPIPPANVNIPPNDFFQGGGVYAPGATTSSLNSDISTMNSVISGTDNNFEQINSVKISEIKTTLNGRINEINQCKSGLNQERNLLAGDSLTKSQADKLAESAYLNGEDKQLAQQLIDLKIKQNKLGQDEEAILAFGKENGLDKTIWSKAPEIFKGEGLRYYESSMVAIENSKQVFGREVVAIQTKRETLEARLQTPEAHSEIATKSEEILAQDKERLATLKPLDSKLAELKTEKNAIIELRNAIPSKRLANEIFLQGNVNDVNNILRHIAPIKAQVALARTNERGLSR